MWTGLGLGSGSGYIYSNSVLQLIPSFYVLVPTLWRLPLPQHPSHHHPRERCSGDSLLLGGPVAVLQRHPGGRCPGGRVLRRQLQSQVRCVIWDLYIAVSYVQLCSPKTDCIFHCVWFISTGARNLNYWSLGPSYICGGIRILNYNVAVRAYTMQCGTWTIYNDPVTVRTFEDGIYRIYFLLYVSGV